MGYWANVKTQLQDQADSGRYIAALAYPYLGSDAVTDPDPALYANQAELMQRLSWVYSAVMRTAETAASIADFDVYQLNGEDKKEIVNHPLEQRLRAPNPFQSRFEFYADIVGYLKLAGNSYIWQNALSPDIPPAELYCLRPDRVTIVPDAEKKIKGYLYTIEGRELLFDAAEIVHIKTFHPLNDWYGLSAIEALSMAAESDFKQAQWNRNFFGRDNAKPQGALQYAEMIDDTTWEKMKADMKREHGGTERRMLMLRGAGKGGVQYVQMGLAQKDMEFLAGRKFNKEEIWSTLAPGLIQIMDPNAAEANAVAGEKTFREYCIWPMLQMIGEKFQAQIVPRYGENLLGEFAEIRVRDRVLELQERKAYAEVHTVDEIRAKFDNDKPLAVVMGRPDPRGGLLPAEVAPAARSDTALLQSGGAMPPGPNGQPQNGQPTPPARLSNTQAGETDPFESQQDANGNGLDAADVLKTLEREQFRRFAQKRIRDGRSDKIAAFEFKHLDQNEQVQIIAEARGSETPSPFPGANRKEEYLRRLRAIQAGTTSNRP
ncbi:MAG: phage portal protein [Anaerolineae bacterium]